MEAPAPLTITWRAIYFLLTFIYSYMDFWLLTYICQKYQEGTVQIRKSITVIDDDPSVQRVVAKALGTKGYRIRTALSDQEALMTADYQILR